MATALPVIPRPEGAEGGEGDNMQVEDVRYRKGGGGDSCAGLLPTIQSVVGSAGRAKCYLNLFRHESSCKHTLPQRKGQAGNPYAAYGLCSLEASPAVRRQNQRGPDCNNISSVVNQIKCCRAIMRKTPHYFGPVNRGECRRCD
jgi:hypothetical protein